MIIFRDTRRFELTLEDHDGTWVAKLQAFVPGRLYPTSYLLRQFATRQEAIDALVGAAGRNEALELASRKARSEGDARFYRRAAEILALYHKKAGPIARLVARPTLFVGQAKSGALVVPVPYDQITWTAEVDAVSASPELKGSPREIWLFGRCSDQARRELTGRGWVVRENVLGP